MAGRELIVDAEADTRKPLVTLVEDDVEVGVRLQQEVTLNAFEMQLVSIQYFLEPMPRPEIEMLLRKRLGAGHKGDCAHDVLLEARLGGHPGRIVSNGIVV